MKLQVHVTVGREAARLQEPLELLHERLDVEGGEGGRAAELDDWGDHFNHSC